MSLRCESQKHIIDNPTAPCPICELESECAALKEENADLWAVHKADFKDILNIGDALDAKTAELERASEGLKVFSELMAEALIYCETCKGKVSCARCITFKKFLASYPLVNDAGKTATPDPMHGGKSEPQPGGEGTR